MKWHNCTIQDGAAFPTPIEVGPATSHSFVKTVSFVITYTQMDKLGFGYNLQNKLLASTSDETT